MSREDSFTELWDVRSTGTGFAIYRPHDGAFQKVAETRNTSQRARDQLEYAVRCRNALAGRDPAETVRMADAAGKLLLLMSDVGDTLHKLANGKAVMADGKAEQVSTHKCHERALRNRIMDAIRYIEP